MKKSTLFTYLGVAVVGLTGTATYFISQDEPASQIQEVKTLSKSKQQAFLDGLIEKVTNGAKPSEINKELLSTIKGLDKENASEAVYVLLSSVSMEQGNQIAKYRVVGDGVVSAYNDEQFKSGRNETYKKVEDKAVQGYLQELKRQYLFVEDDGDGLYLSQDLRLIQDKYKEYLTSPLQSIFAIRLDNQEKPYVDGNKTNYDMNTMIERLLVIEGERDIWKGTVYESEMLALQEQLYMDFFGVTHETYFEEKGGKMVMKEEVKEKMYELQNEYSNSFMGEEILGYMDELENDNFVKKDSQTFVLKRMTERFSVEPDEQAPITMNEEGTEE
ncbi:hypothetical protein [Rossellomorea marisflavi]|uniref:hypothetical protein n=1 Tax=Rossellomorea marisflavi TaxID=189381 RepID=UPI003FA02941